MNSNTSINTKTTNMHNMSGWFDNVNTDYDVEYSSLTEW
jgi:hypothetical protein